MTHRKEDFYDLLFEVSNENRHSILKLIEKEPSNLTNIAKDSELNLPEARRHITRLAEVGVIQRKPNGDYYITSFGQRILEQMDTILFFHKNKDYFNSHIVEELPHEFKIRLGDLSASSLLDKMLEFLQSIEQIVMRANEHLMLLVDEIPYLIIPALSDALSRGVELDLLTKKTSPTSPDVEKIIYSPQTRHNQYEKTNILLVLSNQMAAVAFPQVDGNIDYTGFSSSDPWTLKWGRALFDQLWSQANATEYSDEYSNGNSVTVTGRDDPSFDLQAIQDAVDNYNIVTLRGIFNLGSSGVLVTRSCIIRGEGRENDIPSTKIYKSKWQIPFTTDEWVIRTRGKGVNVSIENIHFTDFNGICIEGYGGENLTIKDNRITLETGYARGRRHPYGDMVSGIHVGRFGEPEPDIEYYPGEVRIENNYLDFALSYLRGGYIPRNPRWDEVDYPPNVFDEYYLGAGIFINHVVNVVIIIGNTVKNMNAIGINTSDCMSSADIHINSNNVSSDIYGAHAHGETESSIGISAHSASSFRNRSGFKLEIVDNKIALSKPMYIGIRVAGPFNAPVGSGKFTGGCVKDNEIYLDDGYIGIKLGRTDNVDVGGNIVKGKVYYGIKVHAQSSPNDITMYSKVNRIMDNDMSQLEIKDDEYSKNNGNGLIFSDREDGARTAYIWLDRYSKDCLLQIGGTDSVIDDGESNKISVT